MHFFSKEKRFFGGHGIVGGQIGLGAGIAFAEQYPGALSYYKRGGLAPQARFDSAASPYTVFMGMMSELLLAVAAGETATGAALVGRDGDQLRVLERLDAPTTAQAATVLEQLRAWRQQYRNACWPLPPDTGWAYAKGELTNPGTGKGWRDARNSWEGGFASSGERRDAVQALCFGSDLPLADLLTPAVQELALALHEPLLAVHRVVKS